MHRTGKRVFRIALATAVVSAGMGAFATSASASDNTWINNYSVSGDCIKAAADPGEPVIEAGCDYNDLSELWSRQGQLIKRAYADQCLDSNADGKVYWLQCNGGDYQRWDYVDAGNGSVTVRDLATQKYLVMDEGGIRTIDGPVNDLGFWYFYGGD